MKLILLLSSALAALLFSGCSRDAGSTSSGSSQKPEKIIVALIPDKNPEKMLQERNVLAAFLSDQLDKPVEVIVPLSSGVILEGFANGTIDLAYLSATDMLNAVKRGSAEILLAGQIDGNPYYMSYWVALKDKPYTSIADLEGKRIAFASNTSTSGYLIPHWSLIKRGLLQEKASPEEFFGRGNVWYGSGYVSAVEQVLSGSAEAAAVSYYVLDEERHLSPEQRARLKKIDEQGPVPTHVLAVRSAISPGLKGRLKEAIQSLNAPDNHDLRNKLFTSELVEVDSEEHLSGLDEAIRLTGRIR